MGNTSSSTSPLPDTVKVSPWDGVAMKRTLDDHLDEASAPTHPHTRAVMYTMGLLG